MPQIVQSLNGVAVHVGFGIDGHAIVVTPARCITSRLRVLTVVKHAHQGLHVALRLHVAPHHAITHDRLSVLCEERRNDGLEGFLTWRDQIGRIGTLQIGAEAKTSVLQTDAVSRLDHTGPKAHVVALNEAHHHAVFIGGCEVNGAALHRIAGFEILCLLHVNEIGAALQIRWVKHLRRCDFHVAWIGHIAVNVGKGQLHGFNLQMLRIDAIDFHAANVEVFQNTQSDEGRYALAIGRNFMQGVATVILRNGLYPFRAVCRQILQRHGATMLI